MGDPKCMGCIDPISKFIEIHRNPSLLCSVCRKTNPIVPISSFFNSNQQKALNGTVKKAPKDLWNSLQKNTCKLLRSFSKNFASLKISKLKGINGRMEKLKKIFKKSNEKSEIVKAVRFLYKMNATSVEKIKYLKDNGGIFEELAGFFESMEIFIESYLFYDRSLKKQ